MSYSSFIELRLWLRSVPGMNFVNGGKIKHIFMLLCTLGKFTEIFPVMTLPCLHMEILLKIILFINYYFETYVWNTQFILINVSRREYLILNSLILH